MISMMALFHQLLQSNATAISAVIGYSCVKQVKMSAVLSLVSFCCHVPHLGTTDYTNWTMNSIMLSQSYVLIMISLVFLSFQNKTALLLKISNSSSCIQITRLAGQHRVSLD